MKRFSIFAAFIACAISMASCQKSEISPVDEVSYHTVTFTADIAETKTVLAGTRANWCDGDAEFFNVFEVYSTTSMTETGEEKVQEVKIAPNTTTVTFNGDYTIASINAQFADYEGEGTFVGYDAIVAKELSNAKNPKVKSEQNPTSVSYDPESDILVAQRISAGETDNMLFTFKRPVSINKMTLKGLEIGETVSTVELSTESTLFAGYYQVGKKEFSSGSKTITCSLSNATIGQDGILVVYFVSGVGEYTPTITVKSDKNTYTKEFARAITFGANDLHSFNVNLAGCGEPISSDVIYTLVESIDDLFSGAKYILAASGSEVAMGNYGGGNNHPQVAITKNSNTITINNSITVLPVVITECGGYYTIVNAGSDKYDGYYLNQPSNDNYMKEVESSTGDDIKWSISINSDKQALIQSVRNPNYVVRYNSSSKIFSAYKGTQNPVALYVDKTTCVEDTTPKIIVSGTELSLDSDGNSEETITVAGNEYLTSTITASVATDAQDWLEADVEDGELVVAAGVNTSPESRSTTITLSAEGAESVEVSVTQAGKVAPGSGKYVKVTSTSDLVDGKYLIVYEKGYVALNGALTSDIASNTVDVTISNGEIASTQAIDAAALTFSAADGSFLGGGGKYIGHSGSSNTLNYSTSALTNTISFNNGDAVIANGNYTMRYNASTGQERFRYYTSGQQAIQLYKYVSSTTPDVTVASIAVKTEPAKVSYTAGDKFDPSGLVITKTMSDNSTEDVSYSGHENEFSFNPTLTTALTTSDTAVEITYGGKSVNQAITVNAGGGQGGGNNKTCLDMTTKEYGTSAYNSSLKYGDWTIVNGANNNKGWAYFKMGGKSATISSYNPCYIYNTIAISHSVKKITVHLPEGSLSKSGMSVKSWGVYVYSDKEMTTQVDYVAGGTITKTEGSFDFTPSAGKTWNANYYYKISWDLANTTTTNGIVNVDKITLHENN